MWSNFHQFRISEAHIKLWKEFLLSLRLHVNDDDLFLQQSVTLKVFEKILPEFFCGQATSTVAVDHH